MEMLLFAIEGNDKSMLEQYQKTFVGKFALKWKHCFDEKISGNF